MIHATLRARFRLPLSRLSTLAALALLGGCSSVSPTAAETPALNSNRLERTAELEQRARTAAASQPPVQLVFLGDSITEQWETAGAAAWARHYGQRSALNLGVGGDQTQNVLYRLRDGHLDGLHPGVLVLMIGTNNAGNGLQPPEEIRDGIAAILADLREIMPDTRILLLAIFPRGAAPDDPRRLANAAVNRLLPPLCDGDHVTFLDIGATFTEPDGTLSVAIMPDALHLSLAGYERWANAMAPTLDRLMYR